MKSYRELFWIVPMMALLLILGQAAIGTSQAKSAQCQNNLKQFGAALAMYQADYNDYNCYGYRENYVFKGQRLTFAMMLGIYMGSTDLQGPFLRQYSNVKPKVNDAFICPETVTEDNSAEGGWRMSYIANSTYPEKSSPHVGYFGGQSYCDSARITQVKKPAETGAVFDRAAKRQHAVFCMSWGKSFTTAESLQQLFPQRHEGKDNILYFDGHAGAVTFKLPVSKWHPAFGLTGIDLKK